MCEVIMIAPPHRVFAASGSQLFEIDASRTDKSRSPFVLHFVAAFSVVGLVFYEAADPRSGQS